MEYKESYLRNEVEPVILNSLEESPVNTDEQAVTQGTNEDSQTLASSDEHIELGYN